MQGCSTGAPDGKNKDPKNMYNMGPLMQLIILEGGYEKLRGYGARSRRAAALEVLSGGIARATSVSALYNLFILALIVSPACLISSLQFRYGLH